MKTSILTSLALFSFLNFAEASPVYSGNLDCRSFREDNLEIDQDTWDYRIRGSMLSVSMKNNVAQVTALENGLIYKGNATIVYRTVTDPQNGQLNYALKMDPGTDSIPMLIDLAIISADHPPALIDINARPIFFMYNANAGGPTFAEAPFVPRKVRCMGQFRNEAPTEALRSGEAFGEVLLTKTKDKCPVDVDYTVDPGAGSIKIQLSHARVPAIKCPFSINLPEQVLKINRTLPDSAGVVYQGHSENASAKVIFSRVGIVSVEFENKDLQVSAVKQ